MKIKLLITSALLWCVTLHAQTIDNIINKNEVQRIESILSNDSMAGRKVFSAGINKAADFISKEFSAIGLQTFKGAKSFKQEFEMMGATTSSISGSVNSLHLKEENIIAITTMPLLTITPKSGFEIASIKKGDNFFRKAFSYINAKKNYLVLVSNSFSANFNRLNEFKSPLFKSDNSVVFILSDEESKEYSISIASKISAMPIANIVGVLPGKSKKNEFVIFSAHYDHLGIGAPVDGDSIFNGANDDAAGSTAVIMLAKYFKSLGNQERTLIFTTFAAEEIGGYGSQYFSRQLNADDVVAMFNIEMIGTDSKWGNNSAYITGYEKTNLGKILEKNLTGTGFTFYPDPYPDQDLFYRSDNATLAKLGVPAHTISTSKMDSEKFYHTVKDEIGTLVLDNMAMIIKAIALSAGTIINGKDTPSRVDVQQLR
ncbi:MAG: M28 family peptidase [Chitinophagaceae bacterium]